MATPAHEPPGRLRAWMLEGLSDIAGHQQGPHAKPEPAGKGQRWWRVMCLTGVDYFSTLGYQPGIAALAAGLLSPSTHLVENPHLNNALLIPAKEFESGGRANGRALAYLAHEYLGNTFGTVYDVSTIAILWFAGASAMAGLLNLMPRYLPRYGMAPHWARAVRPMVIVFILVAFLVTWIFDADVDAQGGAYATGVLVLISSAAIAVTIAARKAGQHNWTIAFAVISAIFLHTTVVNVIERPDGVKIGACFIAGIILVSLPSRLARAFELRVTSVTMDGVAERFVRDAASRRIRFITNEPDNRDLAEYRDKIEQIRHDNDVPVQEDFVFVEVTREVLREAEPDRARRPPRPRRLSPPRARVQPNASTSPLNLLLTTGSAQQRAQGTLAGVLFAAHCTPGQMYQLLWREAGERAAKMRDEVVRGPGQRCVVVGPGGQSVAIQQECLKNGVQVGGAGLADREREVSGRAPPGGFGHMREPPRHVKDFALPQNHVEQRIPRVAVHALGLPVPVGRSRIHTPPLRAVHLHGQHIGVVAVHRTALRPRRGEEEERLHLTLKTLREPIRQFPDACVPLVDVPQKERGSLLADQSAHRPGIHVAVVDPAQDDTGGTVTLLRYGAVLVHERRVRGGEETCVQDPVQLGDRQHLRRGCAGMQYGGCAAPQGATKFLLVAHISCKRTHRCLSLFHAVGVIRRSDGCCTHAVVPGR